MKITRNKIIVFAFALEILMLLTVITIVYGISCNGQTVILEMTGYDPYDALRGRYLRLSNPVTRVRLKSDSIERYENKGDSNIPVYVVLERDRESGLSSFSYATLDRPEKHIPYIKCKSSYMRIYDEEPQINIYPRINQYYLNEKHAELLDHSIDWDTEIHLTLKIWHGMYVIDGIQVDGQKY